MARFQTREFRDHDGRVSEVDSFSGPDPVVLELYNGLGDDSLIHSFSPATARELAAALIAAADHAEAPSD